MFQCRPFAYLMVVLISCWFCFLSCPHCFYLHHDSTRRRPQSRRAPICAMTIVINSRHAWFSCLPQPVRLLCRTAHESALPSNRGQQTCSHVHRYAIRGTSVSIMDGE
ncbi:unnamed protein product [Ectocarpus sp. 8 AP-2014]